MRHHGPCTTVPTHARASGIRHRTTPTTADIPSPPHTTTTTTLVLHPQPHAFILSCSCSYSFGAAAPTSRPRSRVSAYIQSFLPVNPVIRPRNYDEQCDHACTTAPRRTNTESPSPRAID